MQTVSWWILAFVGLVAATSSIWRSPEQLRAGPGCQSALSRRNPFAPMSTAVGAGIKHERGVVEADVNTEKRKKKKKEKKFMLGYTNEINPFGDSRLSEDFVWHKKIQKMKEEGKDPATITAAQKRQLAEERRVRLLLPYSGQLRPFLLGRA